jgi:hypothetical protein
MLAVILEVPMLRRPLARYVPPLLIVATCSGCPEDKDDTYRMLGDMVAPEGPDISAEPGSVDFGVVMVGETSAAQIAICNLGSDDLHVAETTLAGGEPFGVDAIEADVVPPGDCADLQVSFAPEAITTFSDTLTIASDDEDEPYLEVALAGQGIGED